MGRVWNSSLERRTPLAALGRKAKSKRASRAEVVLRVRQRDRICQARARFDDLRGPEARRLLVGIPEGVAEVIAAGFPMECAGRLDVHETAQRSVYPDGELDETNCVLVCRRHHDWIDDNQPAAALLGLHRYSWEVDRG